MFGRMSDYMVVAGQFSLLSCNRKPFVRYGFVYSHHHEYDL
jgi:hypothetical protein